jgi:malonate transporter and related proteins
MPAMFLDILAVTGPIFLLIALGFSVVAWGFMTKDDVRLLGRFVLYIAVPAMLFRAMAGRTVAEMANVDFLLAYGLGTVAVMALTLLVACVVQRKSLPFGAMMGAGTSISNSGFIGYPLVAQAVGPSGEVAIALVIIVENILLAIALALAESGDYDGKTRAAMLAPFARLLSNPMILGLLAGALSAVTGLAPPRPVARAIEMLATAAAPVALFTIGGTLVGIKVGGMIRDLGLIVGTKLLLHPAAVFFAFLLFPAIDAKLQEAAVIAASVPMLSLFPILGQRFGLESIAAAAVLTATVASFITISMLLFVIQVSGWFVP